MTLPPNLTGIPGGGAGIPVILYIDADRTMREIVTAIFERTGTFAVITAGSGEEALDWSISHRPDVIVSDQDLPGIKGTEVLQALIIRGIFVPFIFFTRNFTGPIRKTYTLQPVFRLNCRNGPEKQTIGKLLRVVYWAVRQPEVTGAGNREDLYG